FKDNDYDPENEYSIPYISGSNGIAYNTKEVEEPESWEDLWNPEYEGHVVVQATERATISFTLQMLDYNYNKPSEAELSEAKDELVKLHPNVLEYENSPADEFVSGEAWIGEVQSTETARAMEENSDISYVLPEEGGILWSDNWVIPDTAENKEMAEN